MNPRAFGGERASFARMMEPQLKRIETTVLQRTVERVFAKAKVTIEGCEDRDSHDEYVYPEYVVGVLSRDGSILIGMRGHLGPHHLEALGRAATEETLVLFRTQDFPRYPGQDPPFTVSQEEAKKYVHGVARAGKLFEVDHPQFKESLLRP